MRGRRGLAGARGELFAFDENPFRFTHATQLGVDLTEEQRTLRIDQIVPNQPVWLHVPREGFARVAGQEGKDGKMDWTKVTQWQLQGDWTTKKPLNVVFIAVRVRK